MQYRRDIKETRQMPARRGPRPTLCSSLLIGHSKAVFDFHFKKSIFGDFWNCPNSMLPECPVHKQVVCCKGCHHQLQILWLLHVLLYAVTDSHQLQIILRWTFPKILMLLTLLISTVRHLCSKLEPSRKSCWGTPWEQFYVTLEISSDITVGIS